MFLLVIYACYFSNLAVLSFSFFVFFLTELLSFFFIRLWQVPVRVEMDNRAEPGLKMRLERRSETGSAALPTPRAVSPGVGAPRGTLGGGVNYSFP